MMKAAWQNALTGMADPEQDFEKLINDLVESVAIVEQNLAPRIEAILPQLAQGINQLAGELLPMIPEVINGLLPQVLEGAEALLGAILETLGSLAETGGPVIAENPRSIIDMLVNSLSDNLPALIQTAADIVVTIAEALLDEDNVRVLSQAAVDILPSLVNAISENIDTLIPAAVAAVLEIADALINNVDGLLDAAQALIIGLADGLLNSLPELLARIPNLVDDILTSFVEAIPDVILFAVELCAGIADYIFNYDWENVGSEIYKRLHEGERAEREREKENNAAKYIGLSKKQIQEQIAELQDLKDEIDSVEELYYMGGG